MSKKLKRLSPSAPNIDNRAIFIITKDRPQQLRLTILEIIKHSYMEVIYIINDGKKNITLDNNLIRLARRNKIQPNEIKSRDFIKYINRTTPISSKIFANKTSPIATNRNICLILSSILNLKKFILIDDDITSFKNSKIFIKIYNHRTMKNKNKIYGVSYRGVDTKDTISRLKTICENMDGKKEKNNIKSLFFNNFYDQTNKLDFKATNHVSGGFSLIDIEKKYILPFPQTYNEFWIWCLVQKIFSKTEIILTSDYVLHLPPIPMNISSNHIFFEQVGIMFYRLFSNFSHKEISYIRRSRIIELPDKIVNLNPLERMNHIIEKFKQERDSSYYKACDIILENGEKSVNESLYILNNIDFTKYLSNLISEYNKNIKHYNKIRSTELKFRMKTENLNIISKLL